MPTYVSKPLAPRTVRTIDLSGPAVAVLADGLRCRSPPTRRQLGTDHLAADAGGERNARGCLRLTVVKSRVLIGPSDPRGYGAVGSASRSQREGQGFESP